MIHINNACDHLNTTIPTHKPTPPRLATPRCHNLYASPGDRAGKILNL